MPEFEFHVSRKARQKYQFDENLFALDGNVVLADFAAARRFAERITFVRGQVVPASDINAMGLIDEIQHILIRLYEQTNPGVMQRAMEYVRKDADGTLLRFTEEFPPLAVYHGEMEPSQYLEMETAGRSHRQSTLEELLMLYLANANPALIQYRDLFDDSELRQYTRYTQVISGLQEYFGTQPGFGSGGEKLFEALLAPARRAPHSLQAQLEYLLERWGALLGEDFVARILRSIDFVKEERIRHAGPGGFGGDAPVLTFSGYDYAEYERFSKDKDWMPRLVLIAKNSYVWLDQLSRKYQRAI